MRHLSRMRWAGLTRTSVYCTCEEMPLTEALKTQLSELVSSKKVLLFMKGNKHFPQCGFSAQVIGILNELKAPYDTVNVLSDPAIREGIKEFSSWPTIPQLYVGGQFVGGCDIVKDMYASGELKKLLGAEGVAAAPAVPAPTAKDEGPVTPPTITLSDAAAKAFKEADSDPGEDRLRLEVSATFEYELFFGPKKAGDLEVTANGVAMHIDVESARRANGIVIDFVDAPQGAAFKITNPNEPPRVKSLSAKELKAMLDAKKPLDLFDVRRPDEREKAKIEAARHLDDAGEAHLRSLDKSSATLVFHCHHGSRSRAAAERAISEGYKNVYNLEGGIDAWSQTVDTSVPRY